MSQRLGDKPAAVAEFALAARVVQAPTPSSCLRQATPPASLAP
jgi:hypothetical protein